MRVKKRIEALYDSPPEDGWVICMDEFGPLSLQPYRGKGWFQQRRPQRLHATYTRPHGVKHLLAALDVKTNQLYGHYSKSKKHADILRFFNVLRRRYPRSERLYIILDNFSPHHHSKVKAWAEDHNVELIFTPLPGLVESNATLGRSANSFSRAATFANTRI